MKLDMDLMRPLLWRHNKAANLQKLLTLKQAWYDQNVTQFWEDWIANVFDLRTANEFGMAVWARILDLPLSVVAPVNTGPQFGFGFANLLTDTTDSGSTWVGSSGAVVTAGQADPNGGTQAVLLDLSGNTGSTAKVTIAGSVPIGNVTLTFQAKLISGTQGALASDVGGAALGAWPTLSTSAWTTVTLSGTTTAVASVLDIISNTSSKAKVAIFNPRLIPYNASQINQNFDNGNFGTSQAGVALTIDQKRILLQLRYFRLISRCTVPEINARIQAILGNQGSVYVLDGNDMQYVTYVFGFQPSSALRFVLENFDVLPRPAGVGIRYVISTDKVFGFGQYNQNFNNGNFHSQL